MELPSVTVVDMKEELKAGNQGNISSFLRDEIAANIERGEQSILFLNRRGANKLITCGECGYIYKCPNCSVSLTYHSVNNSLLCHYCGYRQSPGNACPDCGGKLNYVGAGTQLVEQELKELFPEGGILRMDTDVVSGKVTHEQLFEKFRTENYKDAKEVYENNYKNFMWGYIVELETEKVLESFEKILDN